MIIKTWIGIKENMKIEKSFKQKFNLNWKLFNQIILLMKLFSLFYSRWSSICRGLRWGSRRKSLSSRLLPDRTWQLSLCQWILLFAQHRQSKHDELEMHLVSKLQVQGPSSNRLCQTGWSFVGYCTPHTRPRWSTKHSSSKARSKTFNQDALTR